MRATGMTWGAVVALVVLMGVAGAAQVSLQPGLYERVMEIDAAGSTGKNKDTMWWSPATRASSVRASWSSGLPRS